MRYVVCRYAVPFHGLPFHFVNRRHLLSWGNRSAVLRVWVMAFLGSGCSVWVFSTCKQPQAFGSLLTGLHLGRDWLLLAPGCRLDPRLCGACLSMVDQEGGKGRTTWCKPSKSPRPVTSANIPLAKAKHIAKPSVTTVGGYVLYIPLLCKATWQREERRVETTVQSATCFLHESSAMSGFVHRISSVTHPALSVSNADDRGVVFARA